MYVFVLSYIRKLFISRKAAQLIKMHVLLSEAEQLLHSQPGITFSYFISCFPFIERTANSRILPKESVIGIEENPKLCFLFTYLLNIFAAFVHIFWQCSIWCFLCMFDPWIQDRKKIWSWIRDEHHWSYFGELRNNFLILWYWSGFGIQDLFELRSGIQDPVYKHPGSATLFSGDNVSGQHFCKCLL